MARRTSSVALMLGGLALVAALAPSPQGPAVADARAAKLRELAEARAKVCERMLDYYREELKAPPVPGAPNQTAAQRYAANYEPIEAWSKRLVEARLDAAADPDARVAVLAAEVERINKFAADIAEMARAEPEWKVVGDQVEFYRLDAEYRLAREKIGR